MEESVCKFQDHVTWGTFSAELLGNFLTFTGGLELTAYKYSTLNGQL
jgi:hypothetical protein